MKDYKVDKDIKDAVDEAARLLKEFPHLKYYEAIDMAKKMYERKVDKGEQKRSD